VVLLACCRAAALHPVKTSRDGQQDHQQTQSGHKGAAKLGFGRRVDGSALLAIIICIQRSAPLGFALIIASSPPANYFSLVDLSPGRFSQSF